MRRCPRTAQSQLSWMQASSASDFTRRSDSMSISASIGSTPVRSLRRGPRYPQNGT